MLHGTRPKLVAIHYGVFNDQEATLRGEGSQEDKENNKFLYYIDQRTIPPRVFPTLIEMLRCLEMNEGICGNHIRSHALAAKILGFD